jgi:trimeric autotransporter adhesin
MLRMRTASRVYVLHAFVPFLSPPLHSRSPLSHALQCRSPRLPAPGTLLATGNFTQASGQAANHVAVWDASAGARTAAGAGFGGDGRVATQYAGVAVIGGEFRTAGGATVNYIAGWDDSAWSSLGSGMSGFVRGLAVFRNRLIAVGDFTTAGGGAPANRVAQWDGAAWAQLGDGMDNSAIGVAVFEGRLVVGGNFGEAGGLPAEHAAQWDGVTLAPLGTGLNDASQTFLVVEDPNAGATTTGLWAGGFFRPQRRTSCAGADRVDDSRGGGGP